MKLIKVFASFVMISLFFGLNSAFDGKSIPNEEQKNYDKSTESVETRKITESSIDKTEDKEILLDSVEDIDNSFSESKKEISSSFQNSNQKNNTNSKTSNENSKSSQNVSVSVIETEIIEENASKNKSEEKKQDNVVSKNENNISNDFYNSITHGRYEDDVYTSQQCYAKGLNIQNKELDYVLDWNELHPEDVKSPIINNSICYEVIVNGQSRWYLHFKTTQGDEMDDYLKKLYK